MNTNSQAVKYLSFSNFIWVSSSIVWISSAALQIEKTIIDTIVAIHITLLHFNRPLFAQENSRKLGKYNQLYECSWHSSENNPVLLFYNSACRSVDDGNGYKCVKYLDPLNAAMQSPSQLSKYIQQIMMSHSIINKIQPAISSEKKQTPQQVKLVKFNTGSIRCNAN
jgi:hypothetical protein